MKHLTRVPTDTVVRILCALALVRTAAVAPAQDWHLRGPRQLAPTAFAQPNGGAAGGPILLRGPQALEFDGAAWGVASQLPTLSTAPGDLALTAYDVARDEQLLVQRALGATRTWVRNGSTWALRDTTTAAVDGPLVFHPALGSVVSLSAPGWRWTGGAWAPIALGAPAGTLQRVAPDFARGRLVAVTATTQQPLQLDVFEHDGTGWALVVPATTRPPMRFTPNLAWDPVSGSMLLFGGVNGGFVEDTWIWNGTDWVAATGTTQPRTGEYSVLALDPLRRRLRLFTTAELEWIWDGANWNEVDRLGARWSRMQGFDVLSGHVVRTAVDGDHAWDGLTWQFTAGVVPQPTGPMAYNLATDEMMTLDTPQFGGPLVNATWTRARTGVWTRRTPPVAPPPRTGHALLSAPSDVGVILFGGEGRGDTWLWNGAWTDLSAGLTVAPPAGRVVGGNPTTLLQAPVLVTQQQLWRWQSGWSLLDSSVPNANPAAAVVRANGDVVVADLNGGCHRFAGGVWSPLPDRTADALIDDRFRDVLVAYFGGDEYALTSTPASDVPIGTGCGLPLPHLFGVGRPALATADYRAAVRTAPFAPTLLALAPVAATVPLGGGCTQWIGAPLDVRFALADASGLAGFALPVPNAPALRGLDAFAQAAALQPGGPLGGVAVTAALHVRVGD
ncbi:MAG: hypothetical protein AB7O97_05930 [Planctomycetota bacterium]